MSLFKKCKACLEDKPLTEFYKNIKMNDGHVSKCKKCKTEQVKKSYQKRVESWVTCRPIVSKAQ